MGPALEKGFARRGGRPEAFEIFGGCNVVITDDIKGTIDAMKPLTAMYVGGMGSATHNYHREAMARRGFPDEAARIQELWLAGRKQEAVEAVPDEYHDDGALIGPVSRIKERWPVWTTRGLTGLTIRSDQPEAFDLMADLAGTRDTVAK
jgi:hypothetical protein